MGIVIDTTLEGIGFIVGMGVFAFLIVMCILISILISK